jgi:hypothetical protein
MMKTKATSDDDDDIQVVERPKRQKTKTGRAGSEIKATDRTGAKLSSSSSATSLSAQAIAAKASGEKDDNGGRRRRRRRSRRHSEEQKKLKINKIPTRNDTIQFGDISDVCIFFLQLFLHISSSTFWIA